MTLGAADVGLGKVDDDALGDLGVEWLFGYTGGAILPTFDVLADTVLKEFQTRLGRIGLEYQTPTRP